MDQINKQILDDVLHHQENAILLFFTPFCGTCQLAERMLSITLEAKDDAVPAYKCHVSEFQDEVEKWLIESVPCILFIQKGHLVKKLYAIESVSNLFSLYDEFY